MGQEKYKPNFLVHPGVTLKETLDTIGMDQTQLAKRMKRPKKTINEIIKGKTAITADTAVQLERVFGVSSEFWLNLESNYQITKARIETENKLSLEEKHISNFPYSEMAKWGWVKRTRDKGQKTIEILNFFGVVSFSQIKETIPCAYRKKEKESTSDEALAAWLRKGELDSQEIEVEKYSKSVFRKTLNEIRTLTASDDEDFAKILQSKCASAGVYVTFVPHLKKTYVNGAARWLTPNRPLIQLSIRNRYRDIFLFSFFHEVAHILLHNKSRGFIDLDHQKTSIQEIEANEWASNFLISKSAYRKLVKRHQITKDFIIAFANDLGIGPDIIVGRLQHENILKYDQMTDLRNKLQWEGE